MKSITAKQRFLEASKQLADAVTASGQTEAAFTRQNHDGVAAMLVGTKYRAAQAWAAQK